MKHISLVIGILFGLTTQAANLSPMDVLKHQRSVVCYADDNAEIVLNANRTAIKYTVEGEGGTRRINKIKTDHSTYVAYVTPEVMLTFNKRGSFLRVRGDDKSYFVECKMAR